MKSDKECLKVSRAVWQAFVDKNRARLPHHEISGLSEPPVEIHYDAKMNSHARARLYGREDYFGGKPTEFYIDPEWMTDDIAALIGAEKATEDTDGEARPK